MESGAPASDKTIAAAPLFHACKVEISQRLDAMAHSCLAYVKLFGPGLGKAQVSATQGIPFKPFGPTPNNDIRQGSPSCLPRWRRGTPTKTLQMEASPLVNEPSPLVKAHNPQGMLSLPPTPLRGEPSSSSTPFYDSRFERERGYCFSFLDLKPRDVETTPKPLSMMLRDGSTVVLTKAPSPVSPKFMAKQRDLLVIPP